MRKVNIAFVMKIGEIIRIIVFSLIGLVLMFWIQPLLYEQRFFGVIRTVPYSEWINQYMLAAGIIFAVSFISTITWCVMLLKNQDGDPNFFKLVWYLGLFVLVVVISITVYFNNQDPRGELIQETLISMMALFFMDSVLILYWLPTVTSTPGLLRKRTVPGAKLVNGLINRN